MRRFILFTMAFALACHSLDEGDHVPKPASMPAWATDDNYPADAEPEAGSPTKVAYTLGQATIGWRPKGRPPAQELNTWMNLVYQWILWSIEDVTHVHQAAGWTVNPTTADIGGLTQIIGLSAGVGWTAMKDLDYLRPGDTIKQIDWSWYNQASGAGGQYTLSLVERTAGHLTAQTVIATHTVDTDSPAADSSDQDYSMAAIDHVCLAGKSYYLQVTANGASVPSTADSAGFECAQVLVSSVP